MSFAAVAWLLDESQTRGNEGWVLLSLCHAADADGFAALSKPTLARETCLSETTVWRLLTKLEKGGDIARIDSSEPGLPGWWSSIRKDRQPRLYRLVRFAGSRFATPSEPKIATPSTEHEVATGATSSDETTSRPDATPSGSRGRDGVATGSRATTSDQPVRAQNLESREEKGAELPLDADSTAEEKDPQTILNERATAITRRYYDEFKVKTGVAPPEPFPAILGIVKSAVKEGFNGHELLAAMRQLDERGRPLVKQTVWDAALEARHRSPRAPTTREAEEAANQRQDRSLAEQERDFDHEWDARLAETPEAGAG